MSTITKGRVQSYDPAKGITIVCERDAPTFIWRGDKVRTSGNHKSRCNPQTFLFDVTVSSQTAAKLVPGFEFELVYDETDKAKNKKVTRFAGEDISSDSAALPNSDLDVESSVTAKVTSAGCPNPGGSPSSSPAQ